MHAEHPLRHFAQLLDVRVRRQAENQGLLQKALLRVLGLLRLCVRRKQGRSNGFGTQRAFMRGATILRLLADLTTYPTALEGLTVPLAYVQALPPAYGLVRALLGRIRGCCAQSSPFKANPLRCSRILFTPFPCRFC